MSTKAKCLVIVESAAKAKTILKYLENLYPDRAWAVSACFGHVRDLPAKTIGIDTETWDVTWEILPTKKDTVSKLKKQAKEVSMVYLASDPDLEGYAIAYHLQIALAIPMKKCVRVTFNEITKQALKAAFDNPSGWNDAKVAAQETRRILDRVVGYQISPLLWKVFAGTARGLSAGRVQSAALAMILKRFDEFEKHDPQKSWVLHGKFYEKGICLDAKADIEIGDIGCAKTHVLTILEYKQLKWKVSYSTKMTKKSPPCPFTTSSLQQEAFACHRFPPKMTMSLAQALYEEGLITYMRTDSTVLSEDAAATIRAYIAAEHGDADVGDASSRTKTKTAPNAQEAHEAIRPTDVSVTGDGIDFKSPAHTKLYDLIWRRTVASQMAPAKYLEIRYEVTNDHSELSEYIFRGKTALLTFQGFLRVYSPGVTVDTSAIALWNDAIAVTNGDANLDELIAECEVTRPKLLYTETDLIKAMEKNGIGRPSTYVSIIEKLLSKGYVIKDKGPAKTVDLVNLVWRRTMDGEATTESRAIKVGGTDNDRMVPVELGKRILAYLQTTVSDVIDVTFTATMEANLDKIEHGQTDKLTVLNEFYGPFNAKVTAALAAVSTAAERGAGRRTDFTPFLKWCGVETITDADRAALERLPQNISDGERIVAKVTFGPYGVYVKTKDGKNKRLDKSKWPNVLSDTLTSEDY